MVPFKGYSQMDFDRFDKDFIINNFYQVLTMDLSGFSFLTDMSKIYNCLFLKQKYLRTKMVKKFLVLSDEDTFSIKYSI